VARAAVLRDFDLGHGFNAVAFSPDGKLLAVACDDATTSWVSVVDASSGAERRLCGDLAQLLTVAESADGRRLATVGARGVRLWDMESGRGICDPYLGRDAYLAAFGRDWLAVATMRSGLHVFPLPQGGQARDIPLGDLLSQLSVAPDGTRILALSHDGLLFCVDMPAGVVSMLADTVPSAQVMAISPDSRWVAVGGYGLAVLRLDDGAPMTVHGLNRLVKSLAWSPDSTSIAVAGDGGSYSFTFTAGRQ
jgi:WD40 repeat protein